MKKALRFLLGVFVLTMLWTTPTYAATFQEGANYVSYDGEIKSVLIINGNWVTKPAGTWYEYNYNKYYFIEDGFLAFKEIVTIDGKKYFFDEYSVLRTGSFTTKVKNPDSNSDSYKAMLADENGVLYDPGWYVMGDGHTYYINEENFMAWNEIQTINGKRYSFDINKRLEYGHIVVSSEDSEKEYYTATDENGAFIEVRNAWYECSYGWGRDHKHYVDEKGYFLADDVYEIDGLLYEFDETGRLITQVSPNTGWFQQGYGDFGRPIWYYRGEDGKLLKSGIYEINGKKYYFDDSGVMGTGILYVQDKSVYMLTDENGAIYEKVGWFYTGGYWYYFYQDHTIAVNGIYTIGGKSYYFDQNGKMQTGWILTANGDVLGYADSSGALQTGWVYVDNSWYYVNADYSKHYGWLTVNGATYYLDNEGKMVTGYQVIDNKTYYFSASGAMQVGWAKIDNVWYYYNTDGSLHTGWLTLGNTRYYLNKDGSMATGSFTITNEETGKVALYLANHSSGAIVTTPGWYRYVPKEGLDTWYYIKKDGTLMYARVEKIDGTEYYFNEKGELTRNFFGGWEFLKLKSWHKQGGYWYYVDENGQMASGFQTIGGKQYYFDETTKVMYIGIVKFSESSAGSDQRYGLTDKNGAIITKEGFYERGNYFFYYITEGGEMLYSTQWLPDTSDVWWEFGKLNPDSYYRSGYETVFIHGKEYVFSHIFKNLPMFIRDQLVYEDGKHYLVNEEGVLLRDHVGWYKLENGWVYFPEKGVAATGITKINGVEYCFDSNGFLLSDTICTETIYGNQIIDVSYYVDESGKVVRKQGWVQVDGHWCYITVDGTLASNEWLTIDGKRYYFHYCYMNTTDIQLDGVWYKFNLKGEYTGQKTSFTGWKKVNGEWYYNDKNGKPYTGWVDNNTYYIKEGKMLYSTYVELYDESTGYEVYGFDASGKRVKKGWNLCKDTLSNSKYWIYFDQNGKIVQDWKYIDGIWYYFSPHMATGFKRIDGVQHKFSSSGAWLGEFGTRKDGYFSQWVQRDNEWYYYDKNGSIVKGYPSADAKDGIVYKEMVINGEMYEFDAWGRMVKNVILWSNIKREYVYYGASGAAVQLPFGWNKVSGNKWCYVAEGYEILNGKHTINGKTYLFEDGYMQTGWCSEDITNYDEFMGLYYHEDENFYGSDGAKTTPNNGWYSDGTNWYYAKNGEFLSGVHFIDGKTYCFDSNYQMIANSMDINDRLYGKDGALLKNLWIKLEDGWCYANAYGYAVKGTHVIDGVTYYFNEYGYWME